jgi:hypothetical protein
MIVWHNHRSGIFGAKKTILLEVKKAKISLQDQKPEFGPQNSMVVWHIHRSGILYGARKTIILEVKKAKISLQDQKTEFGAQNQLVVWHIHRSGILFGARKTILLVVKKVKISLRAKKRNLRLKISIFASSRPPKVYFSYYMLNSQSIYVLHDHTGFGPQIQFLGSGSLFSPFWPLKV